MTFKNAMRALLIIAATGAITSGALGLSLHKINTLQAKTQASVTQEKIMAKEELAKYNGTDPKLPIYLAMDGYVYDVTAGREFYETGGPYHDLAGRDSSLLLHIAGGSIIKRKYPVIARLAQ